MSTFNEHLQSIYDDRQSGSAAVLNKLIQAIRSEITEHQKPENLPELVKDHLSEMKNRLSHFAVVDHFLEGLTHVVEKPDVSGKKLRDFVAGYQDEWKGVNTRIALRAIENLNPGEKTILLHSNSSSVVELFRQMKNSGITSSVIQTESRPEFEGRRQAEAIAQAGFPVKLIVDSAVSLFIKQVDFFITGADRIHQQHFVNKIGTWSIALLCREIGIPVYVLSDSRKIRPGSFRPEDLHQPEQPARDIWDTNIKNIQPVNQYFETIPKDLATAFITENGCQLPNEL